MSFNLPSGRSVAEPKLMAIHSRQGVGTLLLQFSVEWTFFGVPYAARVHSTAATTWVQVEGMPLRMPFGHAWPETAWWEGTATETRRTALLYNLFLRPEQVLALEHARGGHAIEFSLDLHGLIETAEDRGVHQYRGNATTALRINPHDWAEILKNLDMRETVFVAVSIAADNAELTKLLRNANAHLIDGQYDAAIGQCRIALDSLSQQLSLGLEAGDGKLSRDQDLAARRVAIAKSVRHLTHLAMHPVAGKPALFSRDDAATVVAATVAAINGILAGLTI